MQDHEHEHEDWSARRDPRFAGGVPAAYDGLRETCARCRRRCTHVIVVPYTRRDGTPGERSICQRCYYAPAPGPPHEQGRLWRD